MVARAEAKYIRTSPTKIRPTSRLIKGNAAVDALHKIGLINQKSAHLLFKVLKSALSNAKNKGYSEQGLFISKVVINPGPTLKRHRAASFGRAVTIRKRTSHIVIELDTKEKLISEGKQNK